VAEEIKRVVGFLAPKAKSSEVHIERKLTADIQLLGDSVKFNQVIANLLANAIDAVVELPSRRREGIKISARTEGGFVVIVVQDFGVGIPPKDIKHIFEPFYTTKPLERGTGLGLTITKRTIEEDFGGSITVTSGKADGTCFELRIPLNEAA
jgi:C4-dicarboxylate-specific signal transduction histidine kinase